MTPDKQRATELGQRIAACQRKHSEAMRRYFIRRIREQVEVSGFGGMVFRVSDNNCDGRIKIRIDDATHWMTLPRLPAPYGPPPVSEGG